MDKLLLDYQRRFSDRQFYDRTLLGEISKSVKLHNELEHPCSSAAACINVLGSLKRNPADLLAFLDSFGLNASEILSFPTGVSLEGEVYDDVGPVIFEWIGPRSSPIFEIGGFRGQNRTSIDAFVFCRIDGHVTQVLIEWKFTEAYKGGPQIRKFSGRSGIERLRRYSSVLAPWRGSARFPFRIRDDGRLGLYDLGYEPLYQLLRMTLLAISTTPQVLGELGVEDYRILHLMHSENAELDRFTDAQCAYSPGLRDSVGLTLHEVWRGLLADEAQRRFLSGYWNLALGALPESALRDYLLERYG